MAEATPVQTRDLAYIVLALVAQWIAHWTSNPEVAGSNPVVVVCIFLYHLISEQ